MLHEIAVVPEMRPALSGVTPVLLAGGAGKRLYPVSRPSCPKSFIRQPGTGITFLQNTLMRCHNMGSPLIICNERHYDLARTQVERLRVANPNAGNAASRYILEPAGRNTAAAIAMAAYRLRKSNSFTLIMPTDHKISNLPVLFRAIEIGLPLAACGHIVTFGVKPDRAATQYGYIRSGEALAEGIFHIAQFTEKPDRYRAMGFIRQGNYSWNSGMFLFSAQHLWQEMERLCPDICHHVKEAADRGQAKEGVFLPEQRSFGAVPSLPFDRAVMEKTNKGVVIPVDMKWEDIGTWQSFLGAGLLRRA